MNRNSAVCRLLGLALLTAPLGACDVDDLAFAAPRMTAVTAGDLHSCALAEDGGVYCWGAGEDGQLGTGDGSRRPYAARVSSNLEFTAVDAGGRHTCGVATSNEIYCWGANELGQLGNGTRQSSLEPIRVAGSESFASVSAGFAHTCALTTDGRAFCWGSNSNGELGIGLESEASELPVEVSTTLRFQQISAGAHHTCALTVTDRRAFCWGANNLAQLGTGAAGPNELTPVAVAGNITFLNISAGAGHSCGATPDGRGYCWGENGWGETGNGWAYVPDRPAEPAPARVTHYGEIQFSHLSAGVNFSCGRRTQRSVYCWGRGDLGQLGNSQLRNYVVPQWVGPGPGRLRVFNNDVFETVEAGGRHACALARDGTVYCWGSGAQGQLGTGEWLSTVARPVFATR